MASSILILLLLTGFNAIAVLQASYAGTPENPKGHLNQSITLTCTYTGADGDGQFLSWYHDGQQIDPSSNLYEISQTPTESTLKILNLDLSISEMKNWFVRTGKPRFERPRSCQFSKIQILSKPGRIETDRSNEKLTSERSTVRRHQGESIRFTCHIDPVYDPSNAPEWSFGTDNEHFGDLPADVQRENNQLIIDQVKKVHRGYYRCTLNHVSLSALLRVKDPYAALWPFVGIVIAVIICVVLILLVEKRQKMAKKAAAAAASSSARDGTEDPLVRPTTKSDPDQTKHSYVNA